ALEKLAETLVVPETDARPEEMKSVPSPWGRLLLFEQALFDQRHPAHDEVTREWRGLMGLLALSELIGATVTSKGLQLDGGGTAAWGAAARTLRSLAPAGTEDDPRWLRHVLIYVDGRPVGALSPRTLVYTGIRPVSLTKVPFVRTVGAGPRAVQRLEDPVRYYEGNGS